MTTQPKTLELAQMWESKAESLQKWVDENDYVEFGYRPEGLRKEQADQKETAAELRRLHLHEVALREWSDKTEWAQKTCKPQELGMHRADALKQRIDRLESANQELLDALRAYQSAQKMPRYGDYQDFVWLQSKMRQEGDPAYGWVCEKHGLGYQSRCLCCHRDFERHKERKDRDSQYARDDALRAADEIARAAITKATGETE